MKISPISTKIYQKSSKFFNKALDSNNFVGKLITKQLQKGIDDPSKFAASMIITSIVSKDAINCFLYTTQSLKNKKIPEEKRKFVAALDLMNGILMVFGQFAAGKLIEKGLTPKITSLFTGTLKNKLTGEEKLLNSTAILHNDSLKKLIAEMSKGKNVDTTEVLKQVTKKCKLPLVNGLGILIASIGTMALVKRTLVPLISTPLAGWFKGKFLDEKKPAEKMTPAMVDSTMPKVAKEQKMQKVA